MALYKYFIIIIIITPFPSSSGCSSRLRSRSSTFYSLYHSPQLSHLRLSCQTSSLRMMTLNSLFLFLPLISRKTFLTLKQLLKLYLRGCQPICFNSPNQSKTEFILIGLPKQLAKVSDPNLLMPSNVTITPSDSAFNLGVIFDSSLTMSDHISSMSKSCFLSICDLRRIRNIIDLTTAKTIATSLIHSKVDYCNSL